jgi:hypothetical protein
VTPDRRGRSGALRIAAALAALLVVLLVVDAFTTVGDGVPRPVATPTPVAALTPTPRPSNSLGDLGDNATSAEVDPGFGVGGPVAETREGRNLGDMPWMRMIQIALALILGWVVVTALGWRGMSGG